RLADRCARVARRSDRARAARGARAALGAGPGPAAPTHRRAARSPPGGPGPSAAIQGARPEPTRREGGWVTVVPGADAAGADRAADGSGGHLGAVRARAPGAVDGPVAGVRPAPASGRRAPEMDRSPGRSRAAPRGPDVPRSNASAPAEVPCGRRAPAAASAPLHGGRSLRVAAPTGSPPPQVMPARRAAVVFLHEGGRPGHGEMTGRVAARAVEPY